MKSILPIILLITVLLANTHTVAISYFDNTSGLEEYNPLSKGLADMLITDLSNVKSIQIVEREKLENLLKEIELGESKFMDESTAQKLGAGLGAGYMLTGSYFIMGEAMRIDARLVNVGTGEVFMGEEITGEKSDFFELEKDLVKKLISALNLSLSKSEERKVKKIQTESFDSFTAYSAALDAYDEGNYEQSVNFLENATKFDEGFDLAWEKLDDIEEKLETLIFSRKLGFDSKLTDLLDKIINKDEQSVAELVQVITSMMQYDPDITAREYFSQTSKNISFIVKIKNTMRDNGLFDMYYYGFEIEEVINRLYIMHLINIKYKIDVFNNENYVDILDVNGNVLLKYDDIDKIILTLSTQMMEKFPTSIYFSEWEGHIQNIIDANK